MALGIGLGDTFKKYERRTVSFISRISGLIALQNLSPVNAVTKMISPYANMHQSHCPNVSFGYSVSSVRRPSFMSRHMALIVPDISACKS
jgi:hypothetical protein